MKKVFIIMAVLLLALALAACGQEPATQEPAGQEPAAQEPAGQEPVADDTVYKLRLATHFNTEHAGFAACQWIADELNARSDGRIEVTVYPSSQLGDYTLTFEEMMKGTMDMALQPVATSYDPQLEMNFIPFMVSEYSQLNDAFGPDSYYQEAYSAVTEDLGIKFLGQWVEGFICIGMTEYPSGDYKDPASPKTELVRVPDLESCRVVTSGLGYTTTSVAYADLYTAMQTGVCDGWFGGTPQLNYADFRDVINYFIPYNFAPENCGIMMSLEVYNALPADLQAVVDEVCAEASVASFGTAEANDVAALEAMEEYGITVLELSSEERQAIADAIWPDIYELMLNTISAETLDKLMEDVGK